MKDNQKFNNLLITIITVGTIFVLWAAAAFAVSSEYVLPSVSKTFTALFSLLGDGEFYLALSMTLIRSLIAFSLSFVMAFLLSLLSINNKTAERVIAPIIAIIRSLPTVAIVLLLLFWTDSKIAPVIVTMLVVMPTLYTNLYSALDGVDKTAVEAGLVDGADNKKCFIYIRLPQALPAVYSSVGGGISLNIKLMVAAEVIAATANSLGFLLNSSKVYFEIATMLAIVLITVVIGCIVEGVFNKLSKKAGEWK